MKSWIQYLAGDPFGGTFLVAPAIALGFWVLGRWARSRGGGRTPAAVAVAETVALGTVVVLVLGREALGLRYSNVLADGVLASGLLLILGHRVWRLLLALRPTLGDRLGHRPPAAFFWLPLLVYLAILPWSSTQRPPDGDEPYYLLMTHSLAYDFDARLSNNYEGGDSVAFMGRRIEPQPGDPTDPDGEVYSRHNLALPLVLAPAYRVAGKWGALFVMATLAAALAWSALATARHYFPSHPEAALAAYSLLAFAPPLLYYSHQVWAEVPAALLTLTALHRMNALGRGDATPTGRRFDQVALASSLLLLPLLKFRFVLVALPLAALAWWRTGRSRRVGGAAAVVVAAGGLAVLGYNAAKYGNPLKVQSWETLTGLLEQPFWAYLRGAAGMLLDCAFGLAAQAPLWLLLVPAAVVVAVRHRRLAVDTLVVSLPYLVVLAPRGEWYGGWGPPFRYGMVLLPLLALALTPLLADRERGGSRALLAGLGALTAALTLLTVTVPGWTYQLATGSSDLLEAAGSLQGADLARLFPSYVRPRPASWLWPLLAAGIGVAWWRPRRLHHAATWGLATTLVFATVSLGAAHSLPTRTIEAEDRHVAKHGGRLYPEEWTRTRVRFRSGWALRPGDRLVAPVVAGGNSLVLTLELRAPRPGAPSPLLAVACGERQLALVRPSVGARWRRVELGPFQWHPGEPLTIERLARSESGPRSRLVVDKIELQWRHASLSP